jgi:hypothetical protein
MPHASHCSGGSSSSSSPCVHIARCTGKRQLCMAARMQQVVGKRVHRLVLWPLWVWQRPILYTSSSAAAAAALRVRVDYLLTLLLLLLLLVQASAWAAG